MKRIFTLMFALCAFGVFQANAQSISFTGYYHQDFDSLENNGATGDTLPNGWYFYENSTSNPTTYSIDNGGLNSGNTYSYGTTNSTDRALGTLASGSNQPIIGVAFTNNTGADITSLKVTFKAEQWRIGNTGTARMDTLKAEISPFATSLTTPFVWQRIAMLDAFSTVQTAGTSGALDGNSNYTIVSQTYSGIPIPNGTTVWLRWSDPNIGGSDDGIAIDSFTLEIPPPVVNPVVSFINKSATVPEGDSVKVSVKIENPNAVATTFEIDIMGSSTSENPDHDFVDGQTYTFPANSTNNIDIWIRTVDDNLEEGNETLVLMLNNAGNSATFGESVFTITIRENDFPTYKIAQLKGVDANGIPDSVGVKAWVKGIVQSPTYRSNALEFSLQDNTGGIIVFHVNKTFGYTPTIGDSVMVLGEIADFFGLTEIVLQSYDTLIVISTTGSPIPPKVITEFNESFEGTLVKLENVYLADPSQWPANPTANAFNVNVTNGTETYRVRIDKDAEVYTMGAPAGRFNVTGILFQNDGSEPKTEGYQLLPRFKSDFQKVYPQYSIADLRAQNADGEADSIGVKAWIRGVVHSENFNASALQFALMGANAGITVTSSTTNLGYDVTRRDSIKVLGSVNQVNGLTIFEADSIVFLSAGNLLVSSDTTNVFAEANESELVTLKNITLVDPNEWTTGQGAEGFNVHVTNGSDTFLIRIDNDIDLYSKSAPTGMMRITGVLSQNDETSPYLGGYYLMPRDSNDIEMMTSISKKKQVALNVSVFPNPANTLVNIASDFIADRIILTDISGKEILRTIPVSNAVRLDVSALKAGIYFIQIQSKGNLSTQKLYKQ